MISVADILEMLMDLGCVENYEADLNGDDAVSVDDLLELLLIEVSPLLIPVTSLDIDVNTLHDILLLTYEYIFAVVLYDPGKINDLPWTNLIGLFGEIGKRLGWSLAEILTQNQHKDQNFYHHLVNFLQNKQR